MPAESSGTGYPGLEETPVNRFFSKKLKGDIISGVKYQGTVYQRT